MEEKYEVLVTPEFEKDFKKFDNMEQERIRKAVQSLKYNPYTGKPLGFEFFREKKIEGKRLYFIVYEEFVVIFLIAFGTKKTQKETISKIRERFKDYKNDVEKAMKEIRRTF